MTLALISSRAAVFCVHTKLVCSWQRSGLWVLQLYMDSLGNGAIVEKAVWGWKPGKSQRRCAAYLPTSSMTGAGQRRKVSSIPAGLSSAQGKTQSDFVEKIFKHLQPKHSSHIAFKCTIQTRCIQMRTKCMNLVQQLAVVRCNQKKWIQ